MRPETESIVITGYPSVSSAVESVRIGVYDYLRKPFTEDELKEAVGGALKKSEEASLEEILVRTTKERLIQKSEVIGVLNRAYEDLTFWHDLMEKGSKALDGYRLSLEAKGAIVSGDLNWIRQHVGELTKDQLRFIYKRLKEKRGKREGHHLETRQVNREEPCASARGFFKQKPFGPAGLCGSSPDGHFHPSAAEHSGFSRKGGEFPGADTISWREFERGGGWLRFKRYEENTKSHPHASEDPKGLGLLPEWALLEISDHIGLPPQRCSGLLPSMLNSDQPIGKTSSVCAEEPPAVRV
jgi:hypothetical protein